MASDANQMRAWALRMAQSFKDAFASAFVPKNWLYRWLFVGENGDFRRVGEHVLADLRSFCFADRPTIFDLEPIVMARREGRREVFMRVQNFLNLDEAAVQKLMELDDGIE
jgi:hypothetical protein